MQKQETNKEGLTFAEWLHAASMTGRKIKTKEAREAWLQGQDPTEWAAGL